MAETTKTFTLYWRDGSKNLVEGDDPADAMTRAGYGGGALRALDFYASGDNSDYRFNNIAPEEFYEMMSERDETREELIKRHWKKYGGHWPIDKIGPVYNIPVHHKVSPYYPGPADMASEMPVLDKLSFKFERGMWEGRPGYRVTCEGVVVEEGPL